jgi:dihydrofolate reductase
MPAQIPGNHNSQGIKMKTILIFVSTLDGKVTKWGDPFVKHWASQQDQKYFNKIWNDSKLVIMGSNTYNADPIIPSSKHLLIIMTRYPDRYKEHEVPGEIEFSNESPAQLVERFEKKSYNQMLVVGGSHVATSFLKDQLIDELWLTIEPKIFGTGGNFIIEENLDIELHLISYEKVNEQGTLITKYAVQKIPKS